MLRNAFVWSLGKQTAAKQPGGDKPTDSRVPARVFSGPQVGEVLPKFTAQRVFGEDAKKLLEPIAAADGRPVVLVFVHKRTRPGIGVTRVVAKFLEQKKKSGGSAKTRKKSKADLKARRKRERKNRRKSRRR